MRKRRRKSYCITSLNSTGHALGIDKNEALVFRQCITYLCRLRPYLYTLDSETLNFMRWLIPEESKAIAQFILEQIPQSKKVGIRNELAEWIKDPDDYPRDTIDVIAKLPHGKVQRIIDYCITLLEIKKNCLDYRGQAEMEKAMGAMAGMLQLTEPEEKLCWLFFICTRWEKADSFFMDHLKINTCRSRAGAGDPGI